MFLDKKKAPEYLRLRINDKNTYEDLLEFPSYVYIEVTADCNASCRMCTFAHKGNRYINDELFNRLVPEIIENKKYIKYVVVQGRGEPLLDSKLAEKIAVFSKENDIPTFLSTNASLLTKERAIELLEAKISTIVLSIDSLNKEVYEKIRHGLNFETVFENVKQFIKLRDEINPSTQIRIRMIEQSHNFGEWDSYEAYWKPKLKPHDRLTVKKVHAWGGKLKISDVKDIQTDQDFFPCVSLWSFFSVLYDGTVPFCSGDGAVGKYNIGNINNNTIKELWRNNFWEEHRKKHLCGQKEPLDICRSCRIFEEPTDYEHVGKKIFPELYDEIS